MKLKRRTKVKRKRVRYVASVETKALLFWLADRGFSAKTIEKHTGIPKSKVYYLLHVCGLKLRDYRDGENEVSQALLHRKGLVK